MPFSRAKCLRGKFLFEKQKSTIRVSATFRFALLGSFDFAMAQAKEQTIFILDVGKSMKNTFGDETGIEICKKSLRSLLQQKLLFSKKDEVALILFGTKDTENELAEGNPGQYLHVSVRHPLEVPTLDFLTSIDDIKCEENEGDWTDALIVAMTLFNNCKGKAVRRMFLVCAYCFFLVSSRFDMVC